MKTRPPNFSLEYLRSILSYDKITGIFRWIPPRGRQGWADVAGSLDSHGHVKILIDGRFYLAHRLVRFYVLGKWPEDEVDHRNGIRNDNRWRNIRPANRSQNQQNRSLGKNNKSGFLGVFMDSRSGRWTAQITSFGVQKRLGSADTPELAYELYLAAKRIEHIFQTAPRYESSANDNQAAEAVA